MIRPPLPSWCSVFGERIVRRLCSQSTSDQRRARASLGAPHSPAGHLAGVQHRAVDRGGGISGLDQTCPPDISVGIGYRGDVPVGCEPLRERRLSLVHSHRRCGFFTVTVAKKLPMSLWSVTDWALARRGTIPTFAKRASSRSSMSLSQRMVSASNEVPANRALGIRSIHPRTARASLLGARPQVVGAGVELAKGERVLEACCPIGVTYKTYRRWQLDHSGVAQRSPKGSSGP